MRIIGITGTLGAGKGTVVKHLVEHHGFTHYSARDFINEEIQRRGLPLNRDTQVLIANELRKAHGPGHIISSLFADAAAAKKDAVIESIRTPGEVTALREAGDLSLWAVDADPRIRFERIRKRKSETDDVDFEKFLADEAREMHGSDPTKQNIAQVMALADVTLVNNGSTEDLKKAIDSAIRGQSAR